MSEYVKEYGLCVLCGKRVKSDQLYVTTSDGYAHRGCIYGPGNFIQA